MCGQESFSTIQMPGSTASSPINLPLHFPGGGAYDTVHLTALGVRGDDPDDPDHLRQAAEGASALGASVYHPLHN
jgi:hypothetical protein